MLLLNPAVKTEMFKVRQGFGNCHAARFTVIKTVSKELLGKLIGVLGPPIEQLYYLYFALLVMFNDFRGTPRQVDEWLSMSGKDNTRW